MFKSALLLALLGATLSALLSAVFLKFLILPTSLIILNTGIHLLIFGVLSTVYILRKNSEAFSSMLLVALILRLLACLVYVLILRLVLSTVFLAASLHFFCGFIIFTVLDTRFAITVVKARK